jgi:hypothetical protein
MNPCRVPALVSSVAFGLLLAGCSDTTLEPTSTPPVLARASAVSSLYVADLVATAATGAAMNDAGDIIGTSYTDPGCGPFCLPPLQTVVWKGGTRIVLPPVPGGSSAYLYPTVINAQGVIAGFSGYPGGTTRAVVWTPNGTGYTARDIGSLPGLASAEATGIDNQGRVVGWSSTGGAIPTATAPFMWSPTTGLVNLATQGYPNERPVAMSPGGAVATWNFSYQLGNPASAVRRPAPPQGFVGAGSNGTAINDAGDEAHFLVSTSTQNLVYLFRLPNGGAWQLLSGFGTGRLSRYGIGSINPALDVTATVGSTGIIAAGPGGVSQNLASLLSPAYGGAGITTGGPMSGTGSILAQVMIGQSPRLMRLVPATLCGANCIRLSALAMAGRFVQDPASPGACFPGGKAYNMVRATATVTSETGARLANVVVQGRFLDSYWTSKAVSGTTNAQGTVTFTNRGSCGVGTVAFLAERATLGTRTFDRTVGTVAGSVIPR